MKVLAFVDARPGVGITSLLYNLATTYHGLGLKVMLVDGDPQATLSERILGSPNWEPVLWELWNDADSSLAGALHPLLTGRSPLNICPPSEFNQLALLVGGRGLPDLEDRLAAEWATGLNAHGSAVNAGQASLTLAISDVIRRAAELAQAQLVLVHASPHYTSISRALVACADAAILTHEGDLLSILRLPQASVRVHDSHTTWNPAGINRTLPNFLLGHVSFQRMAGSPGGPLFPERQGLGPHLGTCHLFPSLLDLSVEMRKPEILLSPADGALGSLGEAVRATRREFETLARTIAERAQIALP